MDALEVKPKDRITWEQVVDSQVLRFLAKLRLNSLWLVKFKCKNCVMHEICRGFIAKRVSNDGEIICRISDIPEINTAEKMVTKVTALTSELVILHLKNREVCTCCDF